MGWRRGKLRIIVLDDGVGGEGAPEGDVVGAMVGDANEEQVGRADGKIVEVFGVEWMGRNFLSRM